MTADVPSAAARSASAGQDIEKTTNTSPFEDDSQPNAEQVVRTKRKRRRSKAAAATRAEAAKDVPADELQRRLHQQERQKLALRLKAAGRPYLRQKPKKPDASSATGVPSVSRAAFTSGRGSKSVGRATAGSGVAAGRVDSGERPSHVVQVIIVPIFWLKREEEMRNVIAAAQLVEKLLSGAGIDCGVDTTVPMSPGQKFKHWEVAGVKLRVEVGPKEAEHRSCILAVCSKPGEVAAKSTAQVGQELLDMVRRQLPELPSSKASEDRRLMASLSIQRGSRPGGSAPRGDSVKGLSIDAAKSGSRKLLGGDDLEDDFVPEATEKPNGALRDGAVGKKNQAASDPEATAKKQSRTVVF